MYLNKYDIRWQSSSQSGPAHWVCIAYIVQREKFKMVV